MLDFVELLRKHKPIFRIDQFADDSLTVSFATPGRRIEVYFFTDRMEYSVFSGTEAVLDPDEDLQKLICED